MSKKICIAWSGGCDSTSVLKQYLDKTDYEIIAVHVDFKNSNHAVRNERELETIKTLLPVFQEIRPFEFYQCTIHTPFIKGLDVSIFFLPIYGVAYQKKCSEIVLSYIKDFHGNILVHKKGIKILNDAINNMATVFYNLNNYKRKSPKFVTPMDGIFDTKKNYIKYIPELLDTVWWCRNPHDVEPGERGCGYCYSCVHVKEALTEIAIESQEILIEC